MACGARSQLDIPRGPGSVGDGGTGSGSACVDEDIATGNDDGVALAVDGDAVFWGTDNGRLYRHDASGNHDVTHEVYADALVLDATYLYARVYGGTFSNAIVRVPRSGGSAELRVINVSSVPFAIRDGLFYFVEGTTSSIVSAPVDTPNARTTIVDGLVATSSFAVDDDNVYVSANGTVVAAKRTLVASQQTPLLLTTTVGVGAVAVFGSTVYVADDVGNVVTSVATTGAQATTCWNDDAPRGVIADSSGLYSFGGEPLYSNGSFSWVVRAPIDACTAGNDFVPSDALDVTHLTCIRASASAIYYTGLRQPGSAAAVVVRDGRQEMQTMKRIATDLE